MIESKKLIVDDDFANMCGDLEMTRCQLNMITSMLNDRLEHGILYETELYDMLGMNGCGSDNRGIIASDISIDTFVDANEQNNRPKIGFVLEYEREVV
jgi:hypothetical protein